jgi:hypothetical protein
VCIRPEGQRIDGALPDRLRLPHRAPRRATGQGGHGGKDNERVAM